ncbi:DUF4232 domain-containing protein [Kitasatospora indigofera]|uniref:DUF4232 domain-containing protein n=1 Tax=Kitasatospora indigofera TaxID=67307 RepID=UPI003649C5AD
MNASDSTNRTSPRSWKSYALGAAACAALLAATACGPGAGDPEPSDRPSSTASPKPTTATPAPTTATPAAPTATTPAKPGTTAPATPTAGPGGTGGTSGGDGTTVACAKGDLSLAATNEDDKGRPVRHLLLTLTNVGSRKCTVYNYPYVQMGADAQAPVAVIEDSDPKALATLAPGEKAYAALLVSGGHRDTYEAGYVSLGLQGPRPGSHVGESIRAELPGIDTLTVDDGGRVTYWMTASGLALRFIMSS